MSVFFFYAAAAFIYAAVKMDDTDKSGTAVFAGLALLYIAITGG
jgi:hypothetical protein